MEASSCADTQLGVENDAAMSKQTVRKDRVFIGNPSEQNLKIDKGLSVTCFRNYKQLCSIKAFNAYTIASALTSVVV
jgi:hypothetical protein